MLSKVLSIQALANELEALIDGNLLSVNYCKPLKTTTVHIDERSMISLIKNTRHLANYVNGGFYTKANRIPWTHTVPHNLHADCYNRCYRHHKRAHRSTT